MVQLIALAALVLGASLQLIAGASAQQMFPARTVRFILPFGAASASDTAARLFAERLSARWGKPVVVENRPGGDGLVSLDAFVAYFARQTNPISSSRFLRSADAVSLLLRARPTAGRPSSRSNRRRHKVADEQVRAGYRRWKTRWPISPNPPQGTQAARLYKCAPQPRPHRRFSPRRAALHLATVPPAMLPPLQGKMVKRKEWQMAEQYVEQLAAARERVVADRRGLAAEVAGPYERGRHEQWRRMIEI